MYKKNNLYITSSAVVSILLFSTLIVYVGGKPIPDDSHYVGSVKCQSCHMDEHTGWYHSLHPKMMRRVDEKGALVADFSHPDEMTFDRTDAVWAIGSKWEQQFMGEEDGHETLLPGAWLVAKDAWKKTGWDGWQVPEPLRRCHGCHTVGLNVETGKFVEPSIGCESCHGPGSWHANTLGIGEVYTSIDAQMCGQCHTRGKSIDNKYFFPVDYRPWYKLSDYFNEIGPYPGNNSAQWWGNGHARKRHQQYYAWKQGGHANSLKSLTENYNGQYGEVTSKCFSCHAGEAAIDGLSQDYQLQDVEQGITCSVCHFAHGDLDKPRITCTDCHGEQGIYHQVDGVVKANHVACPETAQVDCVSCHMPLTGKNGGTYSLHSHTPGIIPPSETEQWGVPNSCANGGCHDDRSIDWLKDAFSQHYGESPQTQVRLQQ